MNNKIPHTRFNTDISWQDSAPTGNDLPLFTYLVNHINTLGSARLISFSWNDTQNSSLDLHLMADKFNTHVIKVIDSIKKDVIREIPYAELQHFMQVNLLVLAQQAKASESLYGTEVALSMYSVLEVL